MTEMRAKEVRVNLILAIATTAIGLGMGVLGSMGLTKNLFLPEYARTTKGVGIAVLIVGLIWLGLTLIKRAIVPPERPPK